MWSLDMGKQIRQLDGYTQDITSVSLTPNGNHIVTGSSDKFVPVHRMQSDRPDEHSPNLGRCNRPLLILRRSGTLLFGACNARGAVCDPASARLMIQLGATV